jgi:hypothetical protein
MRCTSEQISNKCLQNVHRKYIIINIGVVFSLHKELAGKTFFLKTLYPFRAQNRGVVMNSGSRHVPMANLRAPTTSITQRLCYCSLK